MRWRHGWAHPPVGDKKSPSSSSPANIFTLRVPFFLLNKTNAQILFGHDQSVELMTSPSCLWWSQLTFHLTPIQLAPAATEGRQRPGHDNATTPKQSFCCRQEKKRKTPGHPEVNVLLSHQVCTLMLLCCQPWPLTLQKGIDKTIS